MVTEAPTLLPVADGEALEPPAELVAVGLGVLCIELPPEPVADPVFVGKLLPSVKLPDGKELPPVIGAESVE